jgi:threonine/homoserine/homoserine lactone efflux protein
VGEAIGQSLPFAVGAALSPIPIVGVVLMLGTPRARANGLGFIVGWLAGIAVVGGVVLAVSSGANASEGGQPADWVDVLKLAFGVLLLSIALRQWRGRPRDGAEPEAPKWMRAVDTFTVPRSAAFGVALAAVNPKNLLLVAAGAAAIAQTGAATGDQVAALALFAIVATIGVGTPVVLYLALGERSLQTLEGIKTWMATNNGAIMATICAVIGAKLIGDAISGFSG